MLSAAKINIYNNDDYPLEFAEFISWTKKQKGCKEYEASGKYDGNAIGLSYSGGKLKSALTRSDGKKGFDVLPKLLHIVPMTIPFDGELDVRGEVILPKKVFNAKYLGDPSEGKFKNARNYVAGVLSRDEINLSAMKEMFFVAYDLRIYKDDEMFFPTKVKTMVLAEQLGFNKIHKPFLRYFSNPIDFKIVYKDFLNYKLNVCEFNLDGFVIKSEEILRESIGYTDHHPEWMLAVKFPPVEAITEIIDIEWKTGSSGEVVPTGIMTPVDLDGTTVKRAALYNYGSVLCYDEKMQAAIPGAKVMIAKAGDIIPQIYKIITPSTQPYQCPTHCPSCGEKLFVQGIHLWCLNEEECMAQIITKILGGLRVFKTKGIGESAVRKLYDSGIKKIEDYFDSVKFNVQAITRHGQFADGRQLEVIIDAISAIEEITLPQVIQSLRITNVGESLSEQVALWMMGKKYDSKGQEKELWANLTNKNHPWYLRVMGFIQLLKDNGITVDLADDGILYEMTGSPSKIGKLATKEDYIKYLKKRGYKHYKLTSDSQYLLIESDTWTSGKTAAADKLNAKGAKIQKITYSDFIKTVIQDDDIFNEVVETKNPVIKEVKKEKPVIKNADLPTFSLF
jgi:DNA ligase (NAD+)